jgi:hypothetical protein
MVQSIQRAPTQHRVVRARLGPRAFGRLPPGSMQARLKAAAGPRVFVAFGRIRVVALPGGDKWKGEECRPENWHCAALA